MAFRFFLSCCCFFIYGYGYAQLEFSEDSMVVEETLNETYFFEKLNLSTPVFFNDLEEIFSRQMQSEAAISGYRIHILSSNNRADVNTMKAKFYQEFPELTPFISYQSPNFKLRIGNYFYKIDAYRDLKKIREKFGTGFIVAESLKWNQLP